MHRRISPRWQRSNSYLRALAELDAAREALSNARKGEDRLVARVWVEVARMRLMQAKAENKNER